MQTDLSLKCHPQVLVYKYFWPTSLLALFYSSTNDRRPQLTQFYNLLCSICEDVMPKGSKVVYHTVLLSKCKSYCHVRASTVCTVVCAQRAWIVWFVRQVLYLFPMELNMGKSLSAKIFDLICSCHSELELTRITSWSYWSHFLFSHMQAALRYLFVHLHGVVQNVFSSLAICILKIFNKLPCVQAFALVSVQPISASELKPLKKSSNWRKKMAYEDSASNVVN